MSEYENYKRVWTKRIKECLSDMECQPILFLGSGVSKRYFNAPDWDGLLRILADNCPIANKFGYYKQTFKDPIIIGAKLAEIYKEWAWNSSQNEFSDKFFSDEYNMDIFIKNKISEFFNNITPKDIKDIELKKDEIAFIQGIRPYAIITTNYDKFIETNFPDYTPIVGQKILKSEYTSIGEIFKIHGCISEPDSLVFTKEDYDVFKMKKKYLSAKLLTFFIEHPIVFIGYKANDPNIQAILSDIDEILSIDDKVVPNIFMINYCEDIDENRQYPMDEIINLENSKSIRINSIIAKDYQWVYQAFTNEGAIERVNPKLLRALLTRTYDLVRTDIPKRRIDIDYRTLETAISNDNEINKIYGITTINDPKAVNIVYPYTLSKVAKELGYSSWNHANYLIDKIHEHKGYNVKGSDNKYHIAVKTGENSVSRKYSEACIEILKKVKNGEEYVV